MTKSSHSTRHVPELEGRRDYHAVHVAEFPHWKYFRFD